MCINEYAGHKSFRCEQTHVYIRVYDPIAFNFSDLSFKTHSNWAIEWHAIISIRLIELKFGLTKIDYRKPNESNQIPNE